ncbi:hypothetical protein ACFYUV_38260 [Nonomuraea sp. NPDC003560]|uniref:hypothetical protein n=1 Tax=Nonomuraea sp. NPDC003560 TaxID=3364341 RepID=UPI003699C3E5
MSSPTRWNMADPADALLLLAAGVEELEQAGQQQLLASDVIPTKLRGCTEEDLAALGIELGPTVDADPLFRHVVLPSGWSRRPEQDPRGSYLVDEHGRDRVWIFYKAAPHDRRAFMSLLPVEDGQR